MIQPGVVRLTILASGSQGNALLVETGGTRILVDAGLSPARLDERARAAGLDSLGALDAVLVTHAHGDHSRFASSVAKRSDCPLLLTSSARRGVKIDARVQTREIGADTSFDVGAIRLCPMSVPHDAPQIALVMEDAEMRVGLATDLGHVPEGLLEHLLGCRALLLESNYDHDMLARGPYPAALRRRVAGAEGHLSNVQAADLLGQLDKRTERVVLMHLSEKNNIASLAKGQARAALGGREIELHVASQVEPLSIDCRAPLG